ncbi:MAG: DUF2807 domain-containing protein [Bacteroidia bacterium]|nr:DUF2807 domain-containing protein [Bacteroidia bacterium]
MKKSIVLLTLLSAFAITLFQTSCTTEGICRNGNGIVETDSLSLPAFSAIKLATSATVEVVQGNTQEVVFVGDQNVLEALDVRVESGDLIIDVDGCFFSYDLDVFITVPSTQPQRELTVSGSGEMVIKDSLILDSDFRGIVSGSGELELKAANAVNNASFTISGSGKMIMDYVATSTESVISGSGNLTLNGKSQDHKTRISGSGDVFSFGLFTVNTDITVSGSGDADIRVDGGTLDATISGSGDVRFKGTPASINSTISGSGTLEDAN